MAENVEKGILADLPVWARVVSLVGAPTVISLYLVYSLMTSVEANVKNTQDQVNRTYAVSDRHSAESQEGHKVLNELLAELVHLGREQCVTNKMLAKLDPQPCWRGPPKRVTID